MSGSGFEESNSTLNQTNSTELILKVNVLSLALSFAVCAQLLLCAVSLIAIVRVRALRVGQNVYIVNLILCDFARILVAILAVIRRLMKYDVGNQEAENLCVTTLFLLYAQLCWSMWGAVLLQQSRYSTVRDPLAPGVSTRKAIILSATTCAIGVGIAVPPFFTWAKYTLTYVVVDGQYIVEQCFTSFADSTSHISFTLFYYTLSYWLPVAVTIYYLVRTLKIVISSAIERRRLTDPMTSKRTEQPATTTAAATTTTTTTTTPLYKSKALWYVIILVVSNVVLPPFLVVLNILRPFFRIDQNLLYAASTLFITNSLVNWLVYCFWVKSLTRHLGNVLRCRKLHRIIRRS